MRRAIQWQVCGDQVIILARMGLIASCVVVCALPFLPMQSADVHATIACAVIFRVGYKLPLSWSYSLGELRHVHPLASGVAPTFAAVIAFVSLAQTPSFSRVLEAVLVSAGLLWFSSLSIRQGVDRRLLLAAMAAGLIVAGYFVVDAFGTRLSSN